MVARVAILIDGDNISAVHAARIAALGKSAGRVDAYRAYADATNGSGWNAVPGVRLVHAGTGKNAADLLLSIDAMELGLVEAFETFVLATSDGDFTHLAIRLRERGHCVIGAGEQKAPKPFRAACSRFECLSPLNRVTSNAPADSASPITSKKELVNAVGAVIRKHGDGGSDMLITDLNETIRRAHGTRIKVDFGSDWRSFLSSYGAHFQVDKKGSNARVRLKSGAFRG